MCCYLETVTLQKILQGWELKMPDTDINNDEFIDNAFTKAKLLKLNSFFFYGM